MNKNFSVFISTGVVVTCLVGYVNLYKTATLPDKPVPVIHLPFDSKMIDLGIANNERAVRIDPYGALGWSMLCSAYMGRSRESDDLTMAVKAEAAARKSLALRHLGNVGAWNKLVQALLQQHRFKDALAECVFAEKAGIYSDDTAILRVECLIEVGRYDEAGALVSKNPRAFESGSAKTVVARLLDIGGKSDQAIKLLRQATDDADQNGGMPSDAVAWFHTRLGMLLARVGKHEESGQEYKTALKMYPRDYKAMAGLARLAAQEAKWSEAIDWGCRCDEVAKMADIEALVGDAYAVLGDSTKAEEQYTKVATLVGRPSGVNDGLHEVAPVPGTHGHCLDRQYAIYCADHNRDLEGAYAAAVRDFDARRDIYAYDTLAWVCFKRGDKAEAKKGIDLAISRGTKDPMLWYHAGEIYADSGDDKIATTYLKNALGTDPHFDGVTTPIAISTLHALEMKKEIR